MKKTLQVLLLTAVAAVLGAQQGPAGDPAADDQPQEGQSSIAGKVVSAKTGEPLRSARITLVSELGGPRGRTRGGTPFTRETYSTEDGSFVFTELPAGSYALYPQKSGFIGQNSFREVRIRLGAKDTREGVIFRLPPVSVLSGHVLDAYGEPLPDARVVALVPSFEGSWDPWSAAAEAQTDDRGEYRIAGLPSSKFLIGVVPPDLPSPTGVAYREFRPSFYPGVDKSEQGTLLKLAPGEERGGIDFRLGLAPETSLEGVVIDGATGEPCDRCRLMLIDASAMWGLNAAPTKEGIFVLRGATPGEGWLMSRVNGPAMQMVFEKVMVAASGTSEVKLIVKPGHTVSGEVVIENPPKQDPAQDQAQQSEEAPRGRGRSGAMVMLQPDGPSFGRPLRATVPEQGGPIEIQNVSPGPYKVRLNAMGMGAAGSGYLRAVSIDGRELSSPDITVPDGELSGLKIHLAFDGATLSGTVKIPEKADPTSSSRMLVVLMPDGESNLYQTRQMISVEPVSGTFNQDSIPPGRYTAYALPTFEGFNLRDPEVRAALQPVAKKITLSKNEKATLELTLASELP